MTTGAIIKKAAEKSIMMAVVPIECLSVCPANREILSAPIETVDFDEEETAYLLSPDKSGEPPEGLQGKFRSTGFDYRMDNVPRNLAAMLINGGDVDM